MKIMSKEEFVQSVRQGILLEPWLIVGHETKAVLDAVGLSSEAVDDDLTRLESREITREDLYLEYLENDPTNAAAYVDYTDALASCLGESF